MSVQKRVTSPDVKFVGAGVRISHSNHAMYHRLMTEEHASRCERKVRRSWRVGEPHWLHSPCLAMQLAGCSATNYTAQ